VIARVTFLVKILAFRFLKAIASLQVNCHDRLVVEATWATICTRVWPSQVGQPEVSTFEMLRLQEHSTLQTNILLMQEHSIEKSEYIYAAK
jgi:hypothetical protein